MRERGGVSVIHRREKKRVVVVGGVEKEREMEGSEKESKRQEHREVYRFYEASQTCLGSTHT